jgi:hypothetical protein
MDSTMSNPMEVDSDTPPPQLLGPAFSPAPPVVRSPQDKLNDAMNYVHWSLKMKRAGNDPEKQAEVFGFIIFYVIFHATTSETNFIEPPASASAAGRLIEGLDEKGLKEWQDGVEAGIRTGDWTSLASHRTFWILSIWRSGVILLFTAILRKSVKHIEFQNREMKCELFLLLR